jgi:5-methylcytosine-specific restriction endonuclease McrA
MNLRFPKPERRATRKARQKRELQALRASVRRDVFIRDSICRACGTRRPEHLHHIQYRSQSGEDSTNNTCGVCAQCHADIHARKIDLVPASESLGANGPVEVQPRIPK